MVVLPAPLVISFFSVSIERIEICLEGLKSHDALRKLSYVVLVGGFSSSPLVQSIVKSKFHGDSCAVIAALRPDVAIVRGAVLFANNTVVFSTRKARLTYGVRCVELYDANDPEHIEHYHKHKAGEGQDKKRRISVFSRHINAGDDIPEDGECKSQRYSPLWSSQTSVAFDILASNLRDIRFPNDDEYFKLGDVIVPLDMSVPFTDRSILVTFKFGGTELSISAKEEATGKKKQAILSLV